jgi:hypothetical protein
MLRIGVTGVGVIGPDHIWPLRQVAAGSIVVAVPNTEQERATAAIRNRPINHPSDGALTTVNSQTSAPDPDPMDITSIRTVCPLDDNLIPAVRTKVPITGGWYGGGTPIMATSSSPKVERGSGVVSTAVDRDAAGLELITKVDAVIGVLETPR